MNAPTDLYLEERLQRYDCWIAEGRIPVSSRVIPVRESLSMLQWVLPTEQYVYAICSCCSCCCHDLQFLSLYGRPDLVARSDYVAQTNAKACVHCGACVPRCVFGARTWQDSRMTYNADPCYGCGLCVTVCPVEATTMNKRVQ